MHIISASYITLIPNIHKHATIYVYIYCINPLLKNIFSKISNKVITQVYDHILIQQSVFQHYYKWNIVYIQAYKAASASEDYRL